LADTIEDGYSGFLFKDFSVTGLTGAIRRALDTFAVPEKLSTMRRFAMARSFGWSNSAARYQALYQSRAA
jgi:starch synthase